MKDVPKFVPQRMAQPAGGDHPEANLLGAFAEGGLNGREREQVLSHLGKCAMCRETLAVAMPAITAEHPHAAAAPSGMRWLRWPMLRWAGVGAAVVVVAAAVVIQSSRRSAEMPKISVAAPAEKPEPAKEPAKPAAVSETAPVLADHVSRKEAATGRDVQAKAEHRADNKKDVFTGHFANAAPAPPQANKVAESNAPATLVPSASEKVEVSAESGVMKVEEAKSQGRGQSGPDGMKSARARPAAEARATTAAGSVALAGVAAGPAAAPASGGPLMQSALAVAPHWRLSSEGALERSTDAGRTWQLVRVAAQPDTLRSFCTVDRDIWAGGTGGALYHSGDNGRTWERVPVKAGEAALDADIVRIEFIDAQHGALTTVAGEKWTTGDAGLTWSVHR